MGTRAILLNYSAARTDERLAERVQFGDVTYRIAHSNLVSGMVVVHVTTDPMEGGTTVLQILKFNMGFANPKAATADKLRSEMVDARKKYNLKFTSTEMDADIAHMLAKPDRVPGEAR